MLQHLQNVSIFDWVSYSITKSSIVLFICRLPSDHLYFIDKTVHAQMQMGYTAAGTNQVQTATVPNVIDALRFVCRHQNAPKESLASGKGFIIS